MDPQPDIFEELRVAFHRVVQKFVERKLNLETVGRDRIEPITTSIQLFGQVSENQLHETLPMMFITNQTASLGTLSRLPEEIRRAVWLHVLHGCFHDLDPDSEWRFQRTDAAQRFSNPMDAFDVPVYQIGDVWGAKFEVTTAIGRETWESVRLTSKAVLAEWQDLLLSTRLFSFRCVKTLQDFLAPMSPYQLERITRMGFVLFCCDCCWTQGEVTEPTEEWTDVLANLPKEIRQVCYEIGAPVPATEEEARFQIACSDDALEKACAGLHVMNQRVLRGLKPGVTTRMTGRVYRRLLNKGERDVLNGVLRNGVAPS